MSVVGPAIAEIDPNTRNTLTPDLRLTASAADIPFGDFAEAIDVLETANGERVGGSSTIVAALVEVLAAEIAENAARYAR
jgi:hypothetical protein